MTTIEEISAQVTELALKVGSVSHSPADKRSVRAYKVLWHKECPDVQVVDIGGFAHMYCPCCRTLANTQAVAMRCTLEESAHVSPVPGEVTVPEVTHHAG